MIHKISTWLQVDLFSHGIYFQTLTSQSMHTMLLTLESDTLLDSDKPLYHPYQIPKFHGRLIIICSSICILCSNPSWGWTRSFCHLSSYIHVVLIKNARACKLCMPSREKLTHTHTPLSWTWSFHCCYCDRAKYLSYATSRSRRSEKVEGCNARGCSLSHCVEVCEKERACGERFAAPAYYRVVASSFQHNIPTGLYTKRREKVGSSLVQNRITLTVSLFTETSTLRGTEVQRALVRMWLFLTWFKNNYHLLE